MSTTKLGFCKATPLDVSVLLPLIRSAYRGDSSRAGWTNEADLVADDRIDEDGLLVKINEPQGAVLLAHDDAGRLVACCEVLRKNDSTVYFGLFAVNPARQAAGIGRQVLEHAESYARGTWSGVVRMEMSVIWAREELIAWYIRRGFKRTGEKAPFPYEHLVNGPALRDDLYFDILAKDIRV